MNCYVVLDKDNMVMDVFGSRAAVAEALGMSVSMLHKTFGEWKKSRYVMKDGTIILKRKFIRKKRKSKKPY